MKRASYLSGSLLWFGAAVSIAEIFTGTLLAPLGFWRGAAAILAGHFLGAVLLYFSGLIGAKEKMTAMETVRLSFGRNGSIFFSVLNILQLIGWTAIMIISGAKAVDAAMNGFGGITLWCVVIALMIMLWIAVGLKNIGKLNLFAVGALFILTVILGVQIFNGNAEPIAFNQSITFGSALELSIIMPISWLPLISDYTKDTDRPRSFTFFSVLFYFIGSSFMYIIGLGASIYSGSSDVVEILVRSGLGIAAMLIVILSTVTTTFLDVYSAGESMHNIMPKFNRKVTAIIICAIGAVFAIFTPIEEYDEFLYLIGSVFVPMSAVLISDYFIFKTRNHIINLLLCAAGFVIYRLFLIRDTFWGSTIPVVIIVLALSYIVHTVKNKFWGDHN